MPTGKVKGRSANPGAATGLRFEGDRMIVVLEDRREMSLPLSMYPTLLNARPAEREAWEMIGPGKGFHWESLDLDLSVNGMFDGLPEAIPAPPAINQKKSSRGQRRPKRSA